MDSGKPLQNILKKSCGSQVVRKKRTLVSHEGKAPKGDQTDWVLHKYRPHDKKWADTSICQSGPGPKNGEQHGAPFEEEANDDFDGDDDNVSGSLMPHPLAIPSSSLVPEEGQDSTMTSSTQDLGDGQDSTFPQYTEPPVVSAQHPSLEHDDVLRILLDVSDEDGDMNNGNDVQQADSIVANKTMVNDADTNESLKRLEGPNSIDWEDENWFHPMLSSIEEGCYIEMNDMEEPTKVVGHQACVSDPGISANVLGPHSIPVLPAPKVMDGSSECNLEGMEAISDYARLHKKGEMQGPYAIHSLGRGKRVAESSDPSKLLCPKRKKSQITSDPISEVERVQPVDIDENSDYEGVKIDTNIRDFLNEALTLGLVFDTNTSTSCAEELLAECLTSRSMNYYNAMMRPGPLRGPNKIERAAPDYLFGNSMPDDLAKPSPEVHIHSHNKNLSHSYPRGYSLKKYAHSHSVSRVDAIGTWTVDHSNEHLGEIQNNGTEYRAKNKVLYSPRFLAPCDGSMGPGDVAGGLYPLALRMNRQRVGYAGKDFKPRCPTHMPTMADMTNYILYFYTPYLKYIGLYGAIRATMHIFKMHSPVYLSMLETFNTFSNTCVTPVGELGFALSEIEEVTGLPVQGELYEEYVPTKAEIDQLSVCNPNHSKLLLSLLDYHTELCSQGSCTRKRVTQKQWLNGIRTSERYSGSYQTYLNTNKLAPLATIEECHVFLNDHPMAYFEIAAYLVVWLSRFVFPNTSADCITPGTLYPACQMAYGMRLALAPAMVARLCTDLRRHTDYVIRLQPFSGRYAGQYFYAWFVFHCPCLHGIRNTDPQLPFMCHLVPDLSKKYKTTFDWEGARSIIREAHNYKVCLRGITACVDDAVYCDDQRRLSHGDIVACTSSEKRVEEKELVWLECIRPSHLVYRSNDTVCIEPYWPSRFARQFGYAQGHVGPPRKFNSCNQCTLTDAGRAWYDFCSLNTSAHFRFPASESFNDVHVRYAAWFVEAARDFINMKDDVAYMQGLSLVQSKRSMKSRGRVNYSDTDVPSSNYATLVSSTGSSHSSMFRTLVSADVGPSSQALQRTTEEEPRGDTPMHSLVRSHALPEPSSATFESEVTNVSLPISPVPTPVAPPFVRVTSFVPIVSPIVASVEPTIGVSVSSTSAITEPSLGLAVVQIESTPVTTRVSPESLDVQVSQEPELVHESGAGSDSDQFSDHESPVASRGPSPSPASRDIAQHDAPEQPISFTAHTSSPPTSLDMDQGPVSYAGASYFEVPVMGSDPTNVASSSSSAVQLLDFPVISLSSLTDVQLMLIKMIQMLLTDFLSKPHLPIPQCAVNMISFQLMSLHDTGYDSSRLEEFITRAISSVEHRQALMAKSSAEIVALYRDHQRRPVIGELELIGNEVARLDSVRRTTEGDLCCAESRLNEIHVREQALGEELERLAAESIKLEKARSFSTASLAETAVNLEQMRSRSAKLLFSLESIEKNVAEIAGSDPICEGIRQELIHEQDENYRLLLQAIVQGVQP